MSEKPKPAPAQKSVPPPKIMIPSQKCSYCVIPGNTPGKCPDCLKDKMGFRIEIRNDIDVTVHCHCNQPSQEVGKCWICKGTAHVPIRTERGAGLTEVYEEKSQPSEPNKA